MGTVALAVALACPGRADAAEVATVAVRLPITGTRDTQVEAAVLRQLDRLKLDRLEGGDERGVLVLRFEPAEDGGSEIGRAHV